MPADPLLGAKLRAILVAFRKELKPEISSPQAKLRADLIDMVLSRIVVELDGGDPGETYWDEVATLTSIQADASVEERRKALADLLVSGTLGNQDAIVRKVAEAESERRVGYEDLVAATLAEMPAEKGSADELAIPADTFSAYLRSRFSEDAGLTVEKVVTVPGGRSKGTILLDYRSAQGPRQIVVRRDFATSVTGTSVSYEFPVVRAAFEAGLQVPEPLWLEEDLSVIGGRFIAFERVTGKAMGTLFASDATPAFTRHFAGALAQLHAVDIDAAGIGMHLRFGADANPVRAMIDGFYGRYIDGLRPHPVMDAAFAWLRSNMDAIGNERALVHGDAGLHNTMGDGDTLTALLDWEFAHAGDPAEDLTYCKYLVERILPWDEFMAAYSAAGGKPISDIRIRFFSVWRTLHLSILTGFAMEAFAKGVDRDLRLAAIGFNTFPKQLRDLATDLAAAVAA
jgi:aminoglycoside phosphotransferase (APT) family kinase protein